MLERTSDTHTFIQDRDWYDNAFYLSHYKHSQNIDLTIELNHHAQRTLHLGAWQCYQLGLRLQRFFYDIRDSNPHAALHYEI